MGAEMWKRDTRKKSSHKNRIKTPPPTTKTSQSSLKKTANPKNYNNNKKTRHFLMRRTATLQQLGFTRRNKYLCNCWPFLKIRSTLRWSTDPSRRSFIAKKVPFLKNRSPRREHRPATQGFYCEQGPFLKIRSPRREHRPATQGFYCEKCPFL